MLRFGLHWSREVRSPRRAKRSSSTLGEIAFPFSSRSSSLLSSQQLIPRVGIYAGVPSVMQIYFQSCSVRQVPSLYPWCSSLSSMPSRFSLV